jgi:hypothetical protein
MDQLPKSLLKKSTTMASTFSTFYHAYTQDTLKRLHFEQQNVETSVNKGAERKFRPE